MYKVPKSFRNHAYFPMWNINYPLNLSKNTSLLCFLFEMYSSLIVNLSILLNSNQKSPENSHHKTGKGWEKKKKISWHWRDHDIWLSGPIKSNCSGVLSLAHQVTVLAGKRFGSQSAWVRIPALQLVGWVTLGKSTRLLCVSVSSSF